ncbi:MAG: PepSY-associated TM helix domain-containing protein [Ferruginibacter sp.]
MKVFFRRIHLYLAFAAGLVIMTTCFTGAVLVFEEELQHSLHKERYFVSATNTAQPIESLLASVREKVPEASISGIKIYADSTRSAEITFSIKRAGEGKNEMGTAANKTAGKSKPVPKEGGSLVAFVNPYTTEVIELYNHQNSFFYSMMSLHRWLLSGRTGKLVVGVCTLAFLFIIITGIVLWWPKTKNILQQRLKIRWQGGWKRLNHDLHIVLGFYSALFLFVFAFTGLAWSFQWFHKGIYKVTGSSMEQKKPPVSSTKGNVDSLSLNNFFSFIKTQVKEVRYYNIDIPKDSIAPFSVIVLPNSAPHESAIDIYFIDRNKTLLIGIQKFSDRNLGQKVRSTFRPIHVASIFGVGSKIIGFIVCICGVFFPATGYIMWWLRTRKRLAKQATQ